MTARNLLLMAALTAFACEVQAAVPDNVDPAPIIDDQTFDQSLPELGEAELQGPAANSPADEPLGAGPLGADPSLDPEIDAPLQPIAEFADQPVDSAPLTDDESDTDTLAYSYQIEGLDSLTDGERAQSINDRFRQFSALTDGKGKAINRAMVAARLRDDRQLLVDILAAEGFFDAEVESRIDGNVAVDAPLVARLLVEPGPQYRFGTIHFESPPVVPEDLIQQHFAMRQGDVIAARDVLASEANVAVELPRHGYPFAQLGQRDIVLDSDTGQGDYSLPVNTGPRSSFGAIQTQGDRIFDARHITQLARFKQGDLYDSSKIDDLREALIATSLFSVITAEPQAEGAADASGLVPADLLVRQKKGPMRSVAASIGYATGQGLHTEASWTHRNLFPPEGALIGTALAGTQEQGASVAFKRSNAGRRDRSVELSFSGLHSNLDAYEAYTGKFAGRIAYDSTPLWQKRLTYAYGFELIGTNEQNYDPSTARLERRTYYIAALPLQLGYDRSNNLLDPTRGYRVTAKLSPEAGLGATKEVYGRFSLEATAYRLVSKNLVLAGRARIGAIAGAERDNIAPSRRIYGGGGGSVRGFGYQQLGPRDPDGRPIGGRSQVETSIEARYRFGDYGLVGFIDAGQVYETSMPQFDRWRLGLGVGGRFYTNFGPVRLDLATPIARKSGESRVSVYVSIGQAF